MHNYSDLFQQYFAPVSSLILGILAWKTANTKSYHDSLKENNDILQKRNEQLIARLDMQQQQIDNRERQLSERNQKIQSLTDQLASVMLENKQLRENK